MAPTSDPSMGVSPALGKMIACWGHIRAQAGQLSLQFRGAVTVTRASWIE
jgi:hypothetical protein